jgi:hypothetical protein
MANPDQNKIDITITDQQLADIDAALASLEQFTNTLPKFDAKDKARSAKPPEGASDWMNYMLTLATQNVSKMAADFTAEPLQRDMDVPTKLGPRAVRAAAIWKRLTDAIFAGDSDAWTACLNIRTTLQRRGVQGVDDTNLSQGLKDYFSRHPAPAPKQASK